MLEQKVILMCKLSLKEFYCLCSKNSNYLQRMSKELKLTVTVIIQRSNMYMYEGIGLNDRLILSYAFRMRCDYLSTSY